MIRQLSPGSRQYNISVIWSVEAWATLLRRAALGRDGGGALVGTSPTRDRPDGLRRNKSCAVSLCFFLSATSQPDGGSGKADASNRFSDCSLTIFDMPAGRPTISGYGRPAGPVIAVPWMSRTSQAHTRHGHRRMHVATWRCCVPRDLPSITAPAGRPEIRFRPGGPTDWHYAIGDYTLPAPGRMLRGTPPAVGHEWVCGS